MTEPTTPMPSDAARIVLQRLLQLGQITDEPGGLTRTFLSPSMRAVNQLVSQWMQQAGLEVAHDDWGNSIGRLASSNPGAKTLLLGSHLDTVRNAGRYDGPLGVILALAACEQFHRAGTKLPFHIDVLAFSDEEGVRFHSAYLGSKAIAGLITLEDLKLVDETGITLAQAVGNPQELPAPRYAAADLLGYVEAHIEQGPVLEAGGHALGVVTAIAAQSRYTCTFTGLAGHAGTTPMPPRQDALAGAAEFISLVEKVGQETDGLVATVGHIKVQPNVSNVIAQTVVLSLDVRHAQNAMVASSLDWIAQECLLLAERRRLTFAIAKVQSGDAVACDTQLTAALSHAVGKQQIHAPHLVSGAGHDGVILSHLAPIAMLFVRCRKGLSHHPDEYVEPDDIALALKALTTFIQDFHEA
jgi:allantoate deiminase